MERLGVVPSEHSTEGEDVRGALSRYAIAVAGFAVLGLLVTAGPAFAQSKQKYKKQINEYSKQLDTLAEQDEWGVSEQDRKRTRQWIAEAEDLLAKGNVEVGGWLVKQVGDSVDLVQALVHTKRLEAMADEQQETFENLKSKKIPGLKSEIEELREEKSELKQKLRDLQ